jgi:hypothetical protein
MRALAAAACRREKIITSYQPMIRLFERQIEALGTAPFAQLSFREMFEVLVTHAAPAADKACRVFARTLQWPRLSDRLRFGICFRLECAREYCESASKTEDQDEPLRERQDKLIQELLVAYWYEAGREEWFMEQVCPVNNAAYRRLMKDAFYARMWKDAAQRN